jgi:hypothetical protein
MSSINWMILSLSLTRQATQTQERIPRIAADAMSRHGRVPVWQASVVSSQTDILTAAQMLGHAHAEVTARHYARTGEDAAERAAEALERELLQPDDPVQLTKNGSCPGRSRSPSPS